MVRRIMVLKTRMIKIQDHSELSWKIREAADSIRNKGLVAFPTETVYGLGANALDPDAVKKIFEAKKRPFNDPLIVHVSSMEMARKIVKKISSKAKKLMESFWPGPLTLVLERSSLIPDIVTSGLDTVAIRMPSNDVALSLIESANVPVAAPSANLFGKPSPTRAEHVFNDLDGVVDFIIDDGPTQIGVESTILDVTREDIVLLRPGGTVKEKIEKIIGPITIHPAVNRKKIEGKVLSPGMMDKHYSPDARLILVIGDDDNKKRKKILELVEHYKMAGNKVAVLLRSEGFNQRSLPQVVKYLDIGINAASIARDLFYKLRLLDQQGVEVIIAGSIIEDGLGFAIMNRLIRAADQIIKV
ncbi:MAG: L-threonylcarbamoyladenylate synthase [Promethearchaeota archaeon]